MKNKDIGLQVAGALFALVGLAHLLRIFTGFDLIVAGRQVPVWVNGIGLIVAGGLAAWMFGLSCCDRER